MQRKHGTEPRRRPPRPVPAAAFRPARRTGRSPFRKPAARCCSRAAQLGGGLSPAARQRFDRDGRHGFGQGDRRGLRGTGRHRRLRRLPVQRRPDHQPGDAQHPAGDLRAAGQLQRPWPAAGHPPEAERQGARRDVPGVHHLLERPADRRDSTRAWRCRTPRWCRCIARTAPATPSCSPATCPRRMPAWDRVTGYGTTVAWPPVAGARAETGNTGMVAGCMATPGCVAYVGIAYLSSATAARARLRVSCGTRSAHYEPPTPEGHRRRGVQLRVHHPGERDDLHGRRARRRPATRSSTTSTPS